MLNTQMISLKNTEFQDIYAVSSKIQTLISESTVRGGCYILLYYFSIITSFIIKILSILIPYLKEQNNNILYLISHIYSNYIK